MTTTQTLAVDEVDLVYDVRGPLPPADGRPVLLMIGQPMSAEGFGALAGHVEDRRRIRVRGQARRVHGQAPRGAGHERLVS